MARNIAVGIGIMEYPFETSDGFWRWVDLCEQGGLDSIWQTDRIVSRTPILECMTTLAAIAGRTRRIKFGVNVVSVALREPVLLAKQCATIDVLSGGRLLPGFGIGSPRGAEWEAMHIDTTTRGRKTDEALEIISRLWAGRGAGFRGAAFPVDQGVDRAVAGAAGSADVDRGVVGGGDQADGQGWHRVAGWAGNAGGCGRGDCRDQGGAAGDGADDRGRSLRGRVRLPVRRPGRSWGRQGDGTLPRSDGA